MYCSNLNVTYYSVQKSPKISSVVKCFSLSHHVFCWSRIHCPIKEKKRKEKKRRKEKNRAKDKRTSLSAPNKDDCVGAKRKLPLWINWILLKMMFRWQICISSRVTLLFMLESTHCVMSERTDGSKLCLCRDFCPSQKKYFFKITQDRWKDKSVLKYLIPIYNCSDDLTTIGNRQFVF